MRVTLALLLLVLLHPPAQASYFYDPPSATSLALDGGNWHQGTGLSWNPGSETLSLSGILPSALSHAGASDQWVLTYTTGGGIVWQAIGGAADTAAIARDGSRPPTADIPWGSHKLTGLSDGGSTNDAVNYGQLAGRVARSGDSMSGPLTINESTDSVGLVVIGSSGQASDLLQLKNNGGSTVAHVSITGAAAFSGAVSGSNLSGTNTGDVVLGTANGLSLSGQTLSLGAAGAGVTGALLGSDWNIFNAKQNALTLSNVSVTNPTLGALSVIGSARVVGSGGLTFIFGEAQAGNGGFLSATDWSTFNAKQPAGSYLTAVTGDVTASGPGSAAATIAPNVVDNSKLAQMPANTLKGNNTGSTANAVDLTTSQAKTLLAILFSDVGGTLAGSQLPSFTGDVTNSSAAMTVAKVAGLTLSTIVSGDLMYGSGAGALSRLPKSTDGYVLTLASGLPTWAAGGGGGLTVGTTTVGSGTNTSIEYNNAGVLGEYAITGTGNVMMSASPTTNGTMTAAAITGSGQWKNTLTGAASAPSFWMTGSPYAAGSATTNKPLMLLEDAATSTGWSTHGTYIGANAKTGFTGNIIDLQLNGSSYFNLNASVADSELSLGANANNNDLVSFNVTASTTGGTYAGRPMINVARAGDLWRMQMFGSWSGKQTVNDLYWQNASGTPSFPVQWTYTNPAHFIFGQSHSAASAEIFEINNPGAAQSAVQFMNSTTGFTPANVGLVVGIDSSGNGLIKSGANTAATFASTGVVTLPVGVKTTVPYLKEAAAGADCSGSGTLVAGTATITTSCAAGTYRVKLQDTTTGALTNVGVLVASAKNSGNFVVTSSVAIDTSTFDWEVIQAY